MRVCSRPQWMVFIQTIVVLLLRVHFCVHYIKVISGSLKLVSFTLCWKSVFFLHITDSPKCSELCGIIVYYRKIKSAGASPHCGPIFFVVSITVLDKLWLVFICGWGWLCNRIVTLQVIYSSHLSLRRYFMQSNRINFPPILVYCYWGL